MVRKVWLYILQRRADDVALLVFEHVNVDAGIQIPAGTVEPDEDLQAAARRELFEESGVRVESLTPLGVFERDWHGQDVQAHLFAAWEPANVQDEWIHHVTGKGEDEGMVFRYFWLPRAEWSQLWGDFKLGYPALNSFIADLATKEL